MGCSYTGNSGGPNETAIPTSTCAQAAPDKSKNPMNPNSERIEKSLRIFSPLSDCISLPWPWLAAPDNLLVEEFPCEPSCLAEPKLFHTRETV
jgi:hypothetical protein